MALETCWAYSCLGPVPPWAHYREASRAKSNADFISKIEGALQELDETIYWLELIGNANIIAPKRLELLRAEAEQLMSILVTVVRKVKSRSAKEAKEQKRLKVGL